MRTSPRRDVKICEALGPRERGAWVRILSAIQTSETMEYQVLDPLLCVLEDDEEAVRFLKSQSIDEKRHGDSIRVYLLENFDFAKEKPTLSDRVFYSVVFPIARRYLFKRSSYAFAILLFYERFSVGLYAQLLKQARRANLCELVALVESILVDEARHISGLKKLLRERPRSNPRFLKCLLWLVSKDVSFEWWALHNREIRGKLQVLNIDPERINRRRKLAIAKVAHDCTC